MASSYFMPENRYQTLTPSFDVDVIEIEDNRPPHVLICIHGMRDNGSWCDSTRTLTAFFDEKIEIICINYGRLSTAGFLSGLYIKPISKYVIERIDFVRSKFPDSDISILCHSNGSKITSRILEQIKFQINWLFICGSVCRVDDVGGFQNVIKSPILNDVGVKDIYPLIAEAIRPDLYHATGVYGFQTFPVRDRYFEYEHGDAVRVNHIDEWILPVIISGRPNFNGNTLSSNADIHLSKYIRTAIVSVTFCLFFLMYIFL